MYISGLREKMPICRYQGLFWTVGSVSIAVELIDASTLMYSICNVDYMRPYGRKYGMKVYRPCSIIEVTSVRMCEYVRYRLVGKYRREAAHEIWRVFRVRVRVHCSICLARQKGIRK